MFTIRILFPTLTTKTFGICEGTSKQSPNPKNSTMLGPRPGFEIPGSATVLVLKATDHINCKNA